MGLAGIEPAIFRTLRHFPLTLLNKRQLSEKGHVKRTSFAFPQRKLGCEIATRPQTRSAKDTGITCVNLIQDIIINIF
jgi:hypothetical protein